MKCEKRGSGGVREMTLDTVWGAGVESDLWLILMAKRVGGGDVREKTLDRVWGQGFKVTCG